MTAVEWLQSQIVFESVDKELLARWDEDSDLSEYFEQAKEMDKEQKIQFANEYSHAVMGGCLLTPTEFYNETFKSE